MCVSGIEWSDWNKCGDWLTVHSNWILPQALGWCCGLEGQMQSQYPGVCLCVSMHVCTCTKHALFLTESEVFLHMSRCTEMFKTKMPVKASTTCYRRESREVWRGRRGCCAFTEDRVACVPTTPRILICWNLISKMMAFGSKACGGQLGHAGRALLNGINALLRDPRELTSPFHLMRTQGPDSGLSNWRQPPLDSGSASALISYLPVSRTARNKFLFCRSHTI